MPGDPPRSTSEPGTSPPPRTRSSSAIRLITPVELFHVRAPGAGSCGGALPHDLEDEHRRGTVGMAAAPRADREGVPPVTDTVRARRRTWLERAPVELALEARAAHVRAE